MSARSVSESSSASSNVSDEAEWLDVENDEEEAIPIVSLFDTQKTFPSWQEMLDSCKRDHGFDLIATIRDLKLDFHGAVKLVNFIRSRVRDQQPVPQSLTAADFDDDAYFKPVLDNDALIVSLDEILDSDLVKAAADGAAGAGEAQREDGSVEELLTQKQALEAELEAVRTQFSNYRLAVQETLDRRWGDDEEQSPAAKGKAGPEDRGNYYFESYAYNGKNLLQDHVFRCLVGKY